MINLKDMENAYAIAMEIADHHCKEILRSELKDVYIRDYIKELLEKPWIEVKKIISAEMLKSFSERIFKIHQEIFQSAYVVLGKN